MSAAGQRTEQPKSCIEVENAIPTWLVDQEYLDWACEQSRANYACDGHTGKPVNFQGSEFRVSTSWGARVFYDNGKFRRIDTTAVGLTGADGQEILLVGDQWMRQSGGKRKDVAEQEREINTPWNIERAAKLAGMTIDEFRREPEYRKRGPLLDAYFKHRDELENAARRKAA